MEIAGSKLDFENEVDETTTFNGWTNNRVRGQVGELPIGNNDSVKMLWETGYAMESHQELSHCSYDNSSCYKVKAVPVIFGLSATSGYSNGGQNLTISGHGFNSPNISVMVDGVPCKVSSYRDDSVSCEVQNRSAPSVSNVPQVGSFGLRNRFINNTVSGGHLNINNMHSFAYTESLQLNMEIQTNDQSK